MVAIRGGQTFETALNQISSLVDEGGLLRVGFLENASYPQTPRAQLRQQYAKRRAKGNNRPIKVTAPAAVNVPTVAAWNEYGTGTAPPRPFFRTMIRNKAHEWGPALAIQLRMNNYNVDKSLRILGEGIAGQLRESIINTNAPPLAQSTIARKGFSKPLVDTAHMLMSVDYEIV
jgi:hypothetical protein